MNDKRMTDVHFRLYGQDTEMISQIQEYQTRIMGRSDKPTRIMLDAIRMYRDYLAGSIIVTRPNDRSEDNGAR